MTKPAVLLDIQGLTVMRGGVEVLRIPYFSLTQDETVALIGPNGAGKSTFLLALAGLLPAATGVLRYRGEAVESDRAAFAYRRRLAMVFQTPLLFDATVFDNVATGLKIRGLSRQEIRTRVMATLEMFNMVPLADRSARKLSGGEAQRTSLARAFAIRPEMIFLDEPFVSLDPPTRRALMDDLDRILHETGTTALLATHDQMEAVRLSHRMVVMNQGEIVQSGTPVEVMNQPLDEFVASFVGMENVLTGTVIAAVNGLVTVMVTERCIEFPGSAKAGDTAVFCIRPEHVTIDIFDPAGKTSARNVFAAVIGKILPTGVFQKVHLDCGFPLVAYLTNQSLGTMQLAEGKDVFVTFKATAVHLIRSGQ
jgi:tungstate transport system ATP-binding protein